MGDSLDAVVRAYQRNISNFQIDLRSQGIHVGMGSPPMCITCGGTWPCQDS